MLLASAERGRSAAAGAVDAEALKALIGQAFAGVEGTISQKVNAFRLRRSHYISLAKTHLQHVLSSAAINVVRMVAWLQGQPHAKTRRSRFASLAPTNP